MRRITIINATTMLTDPLVASVVAALQEQLANFFCPAYGLAPVGLMLGPDTAQERIYLIDNATVAGALGYHADDPQGMPVGFVFVETALAVGEQWSATLSHEVLEQVADPWCNSGAIAPFQGRPSLIAYEACDAVENDETLVQGVPVSNFVLPAWYVAASPGPWDWLGRLRAPLTLSPGGYALYTQTLRSWRAVYGNAVPDHQLTPGPYSRRLRRKRNSLKTP